jgi:hypothetical protein
MQLNYWVSEVLNTIDKSYETRTYNELSDEFKRTYSRACDLIPLMYDRLTLIDGESHEFALMKIYNDHKDLPGFSKRNINRYLPSDNPTIPRRVVTRRHNSSRTVSTQARNLSNAKPSPTTRGTIRIADEIQCPSCLNLLAVNNELREALEANQKFTSAYSLLENERVCSVPREKHYLLTDALKKSEQVCFIVFDFTGEFIYAEADIDRIKSDTLQNNKINNVHRRN